MKLSIDVVGIEAAQVVEFPHHKTDDNGLFIFHDQCHG